MNWTAIVPIKEVEARKSRLAACLSPEQREALSDCMAGAVVDCLQSVRAIAGVLVLAPRPRPGADWICDRGRGLNAELDAARAVLGTTPVLVIHADLPLIQASDVEAMLQAAQSAGASIAPDRHGTGTNALAIGDDRVFRFSFGDDSFARHWIALGAARVVRRRGLAVDIDTPEDLRALSERHRAELAEAAPRRP